MTEAVQIELIKNIPAIIISLGTIGTFIIAWKNKNISKSNSVKIDEVHKTINSGLSRQLDTAQKLGHAEGMAEQKNK